MGPEIMVAGRLVGHGHPVFVVAEGGANHQGELALALDLVHAAKAAGADAIKFQKRDLASTMTAAAAAAPYAGPNSFGDTYGEHRRRLELGTAAWRRLAAEARRVGILLFASVWDEVSCEVVGGLEPPVVKIPSADLTHHGLLERAAGLGCPVFLSTGMSDLAQVDRAVAALRRRHASFVLLQCTSSYPLGDDDVHLRVMDTLRERYRCPVGYSGHELGIEISIAAAARGACVIERHLTLDRSMRGTDHAASLEPDGFADMVRAIRRVERALGAPDKRMLPCEAGARSKLGKSLVLRLAVRAGERIEAGMLAARSPGNGLSPDRIDEVVGRRAVRDLAAETVLEPSHVEAPETIRPHLVMLPGGARERDGAPCAW